MIRSFKHKGLEKYFTKGTASGIQSAHSKRLRLILGRLSASTSPQDMDLPGLYLHNSVESIEVDGQFESVETGELPLSLTALMRLMSITRIIIRL